MNDDNWVCIKLTAHGFGYLVGVPVGDYKIIYPALVSDSDVSVRDAVNATLDRVEYEKARFKRT